MGKNGEEETEKFKKPILVLKQKQSKINQEIRGLTHKISSKQRFVDASNRKIKEYKKQKQEYLNECQQNERGKRLAFLTSQIDNAMQSLTAYRQKRQSLENVQEASIEHKDNERKMNDYATQQYHKENELKQIQNKLQRLQQNKNRSERFRFAPNVSVREMRADSF